MLDVGSFYLCCSVGGADYGSVRIGAFMGRKIIKSVASGLLSQSSVNGVTSDDLDEDAIELLETEASLDYLCNLSPHRYISQAYGACFSFPCVE